MKQFVCLICAFLILAAGRSQVANQKLPALQITTNKTTSLIFPSAIKHVDRGMKEVLVQQVKEAENLLLVKASVPNFRETNLSVITADGHLYSFDVSYDSLPSTAVYHLAVQNTDENISFKNELLNEVQVESYAKSIIDRKKSVGGIKNKKWDMIARVNGIYIKDDVIFYQFQLQNQSQIDYDIEFLRFYVRDKKKSKRTASQEVEITPLNKVGNMKTVKGKEINNMVVALEKFTIPDSKFLAIEIHEKNGGRHLSLKVKNDKIIKAVSLSDLN